MKELKHSSFHGLAGFKSWKSNSRKSYTHTRHHVSIETSCHLRSPNGATHLNKDLVQLNPGNDPARTAVPAPSKSLIDHALHLAQVLVTAIQPPLRTEDIHIRTKDLCPTQTHPRVIRNLCSTRHEMPREHFTFCWDDLGQQTKRGRVVPNSFLNHGL